MGDDEIEINLREIVLTLLHRWKLLLLVMLLLAVTAGAISSFRQPMYTGTSQVKVSQKDIAVDTILRSDEVRQKVADKLGVDVASLPAVVIALDSNDHSLVSITVQATSGQQAMQVANDWAEVGIELITEKIQLPLVLEINAKVAVEDADRVLVEYLQENGLSQLSWVDMQILTGVGLSGSVLQPSPDTVLPSSPGIVLQPNTEQRSPSISSTQRLEISKLMRNYLIAQTEYNDIEAVAIKTRYALAVDRPMVLTYASLPAPSGKTKIVRAAALGAAAGLVLAVFWIFLQIWWQKGIHEENRKLVE